MEYMSVRQKSEEWNVSTQRVQFLCKQGRIPGAYIIGNSWAIPADAEKPKDRRIKSGKYLGARTKAKTQRHDLRKSET